MKDLLENAFSRRAGEYGVHLSHRPTLRHRKTILEQRGELLLRQNAADAKAAFQSGSARTHRTGTVAGMQKTMPGLSHLADGGPPRRQPKPQPS